MSVAIRRLYFQAHKLAERIHDIDLESLDVKTVSEVSHYNQLALICFAITMWILIYLHLKVESTQRRLITIRAPIVVIVFVSSFIAIGRVSGNNCILRLPFEVAL